MNKGISHNLLLAGVAAIVASPGIAADVTPERLANADKEPHNWLMNHRTLRCAALFSAREDQQGQHQESQARLRGRASAALRPTRTCRRLRSPKTAILYVVDQWGVRLQDRRPLRRHGPHRVAHGPRPGETAALEPRRRALGQSRDLQRQLPAAHHRHQQGQRQGRLGDQPVRWPAGPAAHRRAARGQGQDHRRRRRRRPRRARLHRGARRRDRQADLAQIRDPGARRARQRDLEGQEPGRLADRRRRHVGDGHLRHRHQPGDLGHRQSGSDVRCHLSSRRQPLHQQRDLLGSRCRQDELVFPVHAGRPLGLRRGRHAHPGRRRGRRRSRAS